MIITTTASAAQATEGTEATAATVEDNLPVTERKDDILPVHGKVKVLLVPDDEGGPVRHARVALNTTLNKEKSLVDYCRQI